MLVQVERSEYSDKYWNKRVALLKEIDVLRYTIPPRYRWRQRAMAMEHIAHLLGIIEGLDSASYSFHQSIKDGE